MKVFSVTIQMKATEQYFPVVLFIILCKVVHILESESDDKIVTYGLSSTFLWCCGYVARTSSNF